ncbi:hypothetical protein KKA47_03520 [bacterium]|nr:hypothetical protein [bacterium]
MIFIVRIIAFLIAAMAIVGAIVPQHSQKLFIWFKEEKRLYYAAIGRMVIGVIILYSTASGQVPWLLTTIGLIFLGSGLLIFFLGLDRCKGLCDKILGIPATQYRFLHLIPLIFALIMLFAS